MSDPFRGLPLHRRPLERGPHTRREDGLCTMELVAWLAGETHSDEPLCTCPVLTAVTRAANDLLPDDLRDRLLRPLAPRLVGTRGDWALRDLRAWLLADHTFRMLVPAALRARGDHEVADRIAALDEVDDPRSAADAARIVLAMAPDQRAAAWTLREAARGRAPELWVQGVVRAARDAGQLHRIDALILAAVQGRRIAA